MGMEKSRGDEVVQKVEVSGMGARRVGDGRGALVGREVGVGDCQLCGTWKEGPWLLLLLNWSFVCQYAGSRLRVVETMYRPLPWEGVKWVAC
jgi:hypothetical protein